MDSNSTHLKTSSKKRLDAIFPNETGMKHLGLPCFQKKSQNMGWDESPFSLPRCHCSTSMSAMRWASGHDLGESMSVAWKQQRRKRRWPPGHSSLDMGLPLSRQLSWTRCARRGSGNNPVEGKAPVQKMLR